MQGGVDSNRFQTIRDVIRILIGPKYDRSSSSFQHASLRVTRFLHFSDNMQMRLLTLSNDSKCEKNQIVGLCNLNTL